MSTKAEVSKCIKVLRQTKDGSLLILLDKENKSAGENIRNTLKETCDSSLTVTVNKRGKMMALNVKEIDGIMIKAEVKEALVKLFDGCEEMIKVSELRPFYGRNQATTIHLPEELAGQLLDRGNIRIGLNWCRVTEQIRMEKCYRC